MTLLANFPSSAPLLEVTPDVTHRLVDSQMQIKPGPLLFSFFSFFVLLSLFVFFSFCFCFFFVLFVGLFFFCKT